MTLNIEDLYVTSFATSPEAGSEEALGPNTRGCPVGFTAAWTNCNNTCVTCAAGCESGTGGVC